MQLRNKILSHLLLASYLLVVVHNSVSYAHAHDFAGTPISESHHEHGEFNDAHHEHKFHVGIFHFLGHLFKNINHADDCGDDHFFIIQKPSFNSENYYVSSASSVISEQYLPEIKMEAVILPSDFFYLPNLLKLRLRHTPLRAPPTLV